MSKKIKISTSIITFGILVILGSLLFSNYTFAAGCGETCTSPSHCIDPSCSLCNSDAICVPACTDFDRGTCQDECYSNQTSIPIGTECDDAGQVCCHGGSTTPCADLDRGTCQNQCYIGQRTIYNGTECDDAGQVCCWNSSTTPCYTNFDGQCMPSCGAGLFTIDNTECQTSGLTCCTGEDPEPPIDLCEEMYGQACQESPCDNFEERIFEIGCVPDNLICCGILDNETICPDGCPGTIVPGSDASVCGNLAGSYMYNPEYDCMSGYICCENTDPNAPNAVDALASSTETGPTYECTKDCTSVPSSQEYWKQASQEKCLGDDGGRGCQRNTNQDNQCCQKLNATEYKVIYGNYDLKDILNKAIAISNQLLGIVGSIALLFFIIAGIRMIFSGGSEEKIGSARTMMLQTIIGLVIFLSAYLIIYFIQNTLIGTEVDNPNKIYKLDSNEF